LVSPSGTWAILARSYFGNYSRNPRCGNGIPHASGELGKFMRLWGCGVIIGGVTRGEVTQFLMRRSKVSVETGLLAEMALEIGATAGR
jgi:hypothetical protein